MSAEDDTSATRSTRDGAFRLHLADGRPRVATRVTFTANGHVEHTSDEPVAWGTDGLRIALAPGPRLTLRVRRADDGTPIERFGIILAPIRLRGVARAADRALSHAGMHPGGVLDIAHARTGRFRLTVRPADSTGLPVSAPREIEVVAGVPQTIDIALVALATREVLVVTRDGQPVAGANLELLEHQESGRIGLQIAALAEESARHRQAADAAILHASATTDGDGRARLTALGGRELALRLPGPGHVPTVVQPFRVDDGEPARIVVSVGASLHGRITPLELLAASHAAAPPASGARGGALGVPAIRLKGTGERAGEWIPPGDYSRALVIAADGRFVVDGIPAGTWARRPENRRGTLRFVAPEGPGKQSGRGPSGRRVSDDAATVGCGLGSDGTSCSCRGRMARAGSAACTHRSRSPKESGASSRWTFDTSCRTVSSCACASTAHLTKACSCCADSPTQRRSAARATSSGSSVSAPKVAPWSGCWPARGRRAVL